MKRQVAWWLVVSTLTMGGRVWAQGESTPLLEIKPKCEVSEAEFMAAYWPVMSVEQKNIACDIAETGRRRAAARAKLDAPPTTKARSPIMTFVGLGLAVAGVITAVPQGDTVDVVGHSYCVNTDTSWGSHASVNSGACSRGPNARLVGGLMIAAGLPMIYFSMQQVAIEPRVGSSGVGVTTTVSWGSSHAK